MPNGMMRGPMGNQSINGFPPQQGMPNLAANPGMSMQLGPMGVPQMGNAMSPGLNHPGVGGMMASQMTPQVNPYLHPMSSLSPPPIPQMQQQFQSREPQYRHIRTMAPGVVNSTLPNAGSPSSVDPSFNPGGPQGQGPQFSGGVGPNNRIGNKSMSMMPPPSPGTSGPAKDQQSNKDGKSGNLNPSNGLPDDSSRNSMNNAQQSQGGPSMGNPGQVGTAPPTPAPGSNQSMTAPSPSAILSNPTSMNQSASSASDSLTSNLFSSDFIHSVASSLEEFDPATMFRADGDLNFERDFGQWFNPDDVTLDLK